jgi:hypothetical protein
VAGQLTRRCKAGDVPDLSRDCVPEHPGNPRDGGQKQHVAVLGAERFELPFESRDLAVELVDQLEARCDRPRTWEDLLVPELQLVAGTAWLFSREQFDKRAGAGASHTVPGGVRVGTVDKFQGREAPVVLISLASSSSEDAPRGLTFGFNSNRIDVATSRAQCRVEPHCSPRLLEADCKTVEHMRLANRLCRFVELAVRPLPSDT